ncbi:MAG: pilus assembly protein PilP [Desulfobacteraceae bacterium]|jgi:type IV pilus assembly protein PilP|nr:pilus assembly protein PilP [Desulfobacteraceae bacterium]MDH3572473.1 pilus assembly protein PilP [Desulfobacteraceae bacterium]MDH3720218.1 pilus assembly protein PilP [Desulfobacteraceae bacterium]MDH3835264.1 pilus assembly protein PilP [Desulfobacteraceae bacterium]MDH3874283.1 pilus assembly protein PilP [Desulfobacteraceae bacterium]
MNKHSVFIRYIVGIICFFSLLWGCEKPSEPPLKSRQITKKIIVAKKDVQKATAKPKGIAPADISNSKQKLVAEKSQIAKKTKIPDITDLYNPEGKLNPFEPLFKKERVTLAVGKTKIKRRKPLTPLERVNLSQLTLVGIIRSPSGNRALVQETTGKGYVVKKGTFIGTNSGKIIQILKDRIIIEEESEDIYGKVSIIKKPLKLQKPPGE